MFKQTYGFDTDILKRGTPISIEDTIEKINGVFSYGINYDDMEYLHQNKSGTYLICESHPTLLILISANGSVLKMPIRHFIGDNPRMKLHLWHSSNKQ